MIYFLLDSNWWTEVYLPIEKKWICKCLCFTIVLSHYLRFQYNNFSLTFSGPSSYAIKQGFISLEIKVAVDQLFIFVKLF